MKKIVFQDFNLLINGLILQIESHADSLRKTQENDESHVHLHGLALKLLKHLISLQTICEPINIHIGTGKTGTHIDIASVAVLSRSAIECYLVLEWLYGAQNAELRNFRMNVWRYASAFSLANSRPTMEPGIQIAKDAYERALEMRPEIEAGLSVFYPKSNKKNILDGQWMKLDSFGKIANYAGVPSIYFNSIYSYFSGQAHSNASSSQRAMMGGIEAQQIQTENSIHLLLPFISKAILLLKTVCPEASTALSTRHDVIEVADKHITSMHSLQEIHNYAWKPPA